MRTLAAIVICCLSVAACQEKPAREASEFRIISTDSGFEAPDRIASGVRHVVFENRGSMIHEAMLVKLPNGMTAADYAAEVKKGNLFPAGGEDYSGPALTSPGYTAEMWLRVDPGEYILVCWNGKHARTTAPHKFTVTTDQVDDKVPQADVVLKLTDYKFELEGKLRKGPQVIRVETPGPEMHEFDLFRLHDAMTVEDVRRWRKQDDPAAPAPVEALGGALDSHDLTRAVWLRKNLTPGRYVLHCEMPVEKSAAAASAEITHADLGMVKEIEITD